MGVWFGEQVSTWLANRLTAVFSIIEVPGAGAVEEPLDYLGTWNRSCVSPTSSQTSRRSGRSAAAQQLQLWGQETQGPCRRGSGGGDTGAPAPVGSLLPPALPPRGRSPALSQGGLCFGPRAPSLREDRREDSRQPHADRALLSLAQVGTWTVPSL